MHWVRPELVAQVEFSNWTGDRRLRHPSFQGLREDKPAEEVTKETARRFAPMAAPKGKPHGSRSKTSKSRAAAGRVKSDSGKVVIEGVELTHPDRVYYPDEGITKRELAEYYVACADRMLPHVVGRPLSIVRCPDGIGGQRFFQKHFGPMRPTPCGACESKKKAAKGNTGLSRMSPDWSRSPKSRAWRFTSGDRESDSVERPDCLVFDLDPAPDVEWPRVIEAAREFANFSAS